MQRNSEGEDAKEVQRRLKELGYYKGRTDGKFGAQSVAALKKFQEANGLKADGIAGESTYKILFSMGAVAAGATPTPEVTASPVPEQTEETAAAAPAAAQTVFETLRKGDAGDAVRLMQEALVNLGYLSGKSDGVYGDATVQAVRAFQKANGLKVDGTAGNETLRKLYSLEAQAAPTATPTVKPTATPKPTATQTPATTATETLKKGSSGEAVKAMQKRLIALGYLSGKADGKFGTKTYEALVAFQRKNKLKADGIAGAQTQTALNSSSAVAANASATSAPAATATPAPAASASVKPSASRVLYANWYTTVKAIARKYPYATIYDYQTGISWQIHIFSLGAHADYEPLTANDTAKMLRVFGGNTWNPRPVWVIFANGSVYMGSTHSNPHGTSHITDNNFNGHSCLHFPRTQEQVTAIGTYATSHQDTIDKGWAVTQRMK